MIKLIIKVLSVKEKAYSLLLSQLEILHFVKFKYVNYNYLDQSNRKIKKKLTIFQQSNYFYYYLQQNYDNYNSTNYYQLQIFEKKILLKLLKLQIFKGY